MNKLMHKDTRLSIVLPVFNEEANIHACLQHLHQQCSQLEHTLLCKNMFEVIVVNNNSTDASMEKIQEFLQVHGDLNVIIIDEARQGVAWARKAGMDLAVARSMARDAHYQLTSEYYIFSADADCLVDAHWVAAMLAKLYAKNSLIVSQYLYPAPHFATRPRLWHVIELILKARDFAMYIFGGFPDGKGFALPRSIYTAVNGIDILYQLKDGNFFCHLSDDWDFGIKVRASGFEISYAPTAKVLTNPRRIDHALNEMIAGIAYGKNGTICMRDIRATTYSTQEDLNTADANMLYEYAIKDFTTKHIILPILLTPEFLNQAAVIEFLSSSLALKLKSRIAEMQFQMRMTDFTPIHSYKTPCYRLYLEFRTELFSCMRKHIDPAIGLPPPLPNCLLSIAQENPAELNNYIYYFCEDREAGAAHNYFGNGGVF